MSRARNSSKYRRRAPARDAYDRVLIVCEGKKTEPIYFRSVAIEHLRLSTANVTVLPNNNASDPLSVVNYAIERYERDPDYEQVWCVFDRDGHTTYDAALAKLSAYRAQAKTTFHAANSVPCFELWILLHFRYSTAPYVATGQRSSCENVIRVLETYIAGYKKGEQTNPALLIPHLEDAVRNGEQLAEYCRRSESNNPMTAVHVLVKNLLKIDEARKKEH